MDVLCLLSSIVFDMLINDEPYLILRNLKYFYNIVYIVTIKNQLQIQFFFKEINRRVQLFDSTVLYYQLSQFFHSKYSDFIKIIILLISAIWSGGRGGGHTYTSILYTVSNLKAISCGWGGGGVKNRHFYSVFQIHSFQNSHNFTVW